MPTSITGPTEHGPVREVWFATLADPATKHSFLIRDDAYSKGGAVFGRTIRLGDPVTLGPNSTWVQNTWEGGAKQEVWKDKAMYHLGTADVGTKRGKLRLWPGWQLAQANSTRVNTRYIMCPGNIGIGADTPLFVGENNDDGYIDITTGTESPPGGFALFKFDPSTGTSTLVQSFDAGIRCIVPINDAGNSVFYMFIVTANGKYYLYNADTDTLVLEVTGSGVLPNAAAVFSDAVYYGAGNVLGKRTWTSPGPAVFTIVKHFNNSLGIAAMTLWNNRLWMSVQNTAGVNQVFVSDGVSVVPAFTFPTTFLCTHMISHYGSLYFSGWVQGNLGASGVRGQIWRYNGASLTKLYEEGTSADGEFHYPWQMASYKQYLAWTRNGHTTTGRNPGVMLYDAEVDAIIDGPTIDMDPASAAVQTTGLVVWGDTLVASFLDAFDYGAIKGPSAVAYVKLNGQKRNTFPTSYGGQSFDLQPASRVQWIYSSEFDGDVPGEKKNWLAARIHCRVPADTSLELFAYLDGSLTAVPIATVAADAGAWRTVVIPLKAIGETTYLKSTTIRYRIHLVNLAASSSSTATPEVDSISIDFMPSPIKRREWRLRAICQNAQLRLDGTTNPLTTTQAQVDKFEELWEGQNPILFWDAGTAGGAPVGDGIEVTMKDYQAQTYRVQTPGTAIDAEVSAGLTEVVA